MFLNTKGTDSEDEPPELVSFPNYVGDASDVAEQQADGLIQRIEARIADIKRSRGMEMRYMLFSEMLSDEQKEGGKEGREEGRKDFFALMDRMEAGGDGDKIPLIRKSPDLLEEMYKKYHMEI